jgi:hypothetical protein
VSGVRNAEFNPGLLHTQHHPARHRRLPTESLTPPLIDVTRARLCP